MVKGGLKMAIKTETVEVRYCDCCGYKSDIPLTKCPICGRENCYTCSSQLYDVWHTNICKKCLEDENIYLSEKIKIKQ